MQDSKRKLIYVPMVHELADLLMGADELDLAAASQPALNIETAVKRFKKATGAYWAKIEMQLREMPQMYDRIKIYCESTWQNSVDEALLMHKKQAAKGSKCSDLVVALVDQGALLIAPTESIQAWGRNLFLVQERKYIQSQRPITPDNIIYIDALDKQIKQVVKERDKYICKRIMETLEDGDQGILFLGQGHFHYPVGGGILENLSDSIACDEAPVDYGLLRQSLVAYNDILRATR